MHAFLNLLDHSKPLGSLVSLILIAKLIICRSFKVYKSYQSEEVVAKRMFSLLNRCDRRARKQ